MRRVPSIRVPVLVVTAFLLVPLLSTLAGAQEENRSPDTIPLPDAIAELPDGHSRVVDVSGAFAYQYGDDPTTPARLDLGIADMVAASVGYYVFDESVVVDCDDPAQLCPEEFPGPDQEILYRGFSLTVAEEIPLDGIDDLVINYSWPYLVADDEPFIELSQFPGDTWQDMSRVVVVESGSPFRIYFSQFVPGEGWVQQRIFGFGLIDGRTIYVWFPDPSPHGEEDAALIADLVLRVLDRGFPPDVVAFWTSLQFETRFGWSVAVHVHAPGDFGVLEDSQIATQIQTPRNPGDTLPNLTGEEGIARVGIPIAEAEFPEPEPPPAEEPEVEEPTEIAVAEPESEEPVVVAEEQPPPPPVAQEPEVDPGSDVVAVGDNGGGTFPWWILLVVIGGLGLGGWYWWAQGRAGPCDELVQRWLQAKRRCAEARQRAQHARDALAETRRRRDQTEDEIDRLCAEHPPACGEEVLEDTWIEDPDLPGSRRDLIDNYARRRWRQALWDRYGDGDLTAADVEAEWEAGPPADFASGLREALTRARTDQARLRRELDQITEELAEAEADMDEAEAEAADACEAAAAARRRAADCVRQQRPIPPEPEEPPDLPTEDLLDGPSVGIEQDDDRGPCTEANAGTTKELRRNMPIRIPVGFEPTVVAGEDQEAVDEAIRIAAGVKQGEIVANALGRFFGAREGARLYDDPSLGAALGPASTVAGEAIGVPMPTNIPEAAANYAEIQLKAAETIIRKLPELIARNRQSTQLWVQGHEAEYEMTCVETWVCDGTDWQLESKHFEMRCVRPNISTARRHIGWSTWDDIHREIARFGGRYRNRLHRVLGEIADFRDRC